MDDSPVDWVRRERNLEAIYEAAQLDSSYAASQTCERLAKTCRAMVPQAPPGSDRVTASPHDYPLYPRIIDLAKEWNHNRLEPKAN